MYEGIYIPNHNVIDRASKKKAESTLHGWEQGQFTAEEWIQKLDLGQTIQPSSFDTKLDGTYTHAMTEQLTDPETKKVSSRQLWKSTHFICTDGDNLKGIEFYDSGPNEGKDKNPNGLEPWTDPGQLSQILPGLLVKAYAVGQSVSSMLKEPLHRRFRIIFLFDKPITDEKHYRHIFSQLATEFPIISNVARAPSQPVFGNGREGFDFHICGNILSLDDYPAPVETSKPPEKPQQEFNTSETLEDFLRRHHIAYTVSRDAGKYYVDCPYKDGHTGGKQGKTDSYVFDDGKAWAFYCSHAHCADKRTWDAFKSGNGIQNGHHQKPYVHTPKRPSFHDAVPPEAPEVDIAPLPTSESALPVFPDYEGELFIGSFNHLYHAYAQTHVWSPEMIMAMGIGAMSFAASKMSVKTHEKAKMLRLNSYILAVGESDLTAKSEAITEVKKFMYQIDDDFDPLSNIQSIEGLLKALNETEDHSHRYCLFDEASVVFENTRRQGTKNLFSGLNELWVCPQTYSTGRAAGTDKVENPYVCCWGNIPTKLIASVFRHEDMIAGSLNRWLPFYIQPKIETERYPHAEPDAYNEWVASLHKAKSSLDTRTFIFTQEADDARFDWFKGLRAEAIDTGEQTGESRFHTHAVKLAGIFALSENAATKNDVELHHWETALKIIKYLTACGEYLFRNVGATRIGELENEILDILNKHGNEMSLTSLTQKTRRFDREERERILLLLETHKQIIRFSEKTNGRKKMMIRRIT